MFNIYLSELRITIIDECIGFTIVSACACFCVSHPSFRAVKLLQFLTLGEVCGMGSKFDFYGTLEGRG